MLISNLCFLFFSFV